VVGSLNGEPAHSLWHLPQVGTGGLWLGGRFTTKLVLTWPSEEGEVDNDARWAHLSSV
jgi:hypothetical protein